MISIDQDHLNRPEPLFAIPQQQFREPVRGFLDELQTNITDSDEVSELVGVVLFGSVARGTADRRSDIDLLVILDGDATYARRIGTQSARSVEEGSFGGDRFEFEVLVETPESAASHGSELREIFDEGIVLEHSDSLDDVRQSIYADEEE